MIESNKHKELYLEVCKQRFEDLTDKIEGGYQQRQQIFDILKGDNGTPGLLERLRQIERAHKKIYAATIFILCAVGVQTINLFFRWITAIVNNK